MWLLSTPGTEAQHVLHFARRNALEVDAFAVQSAQQLRDAGSPSWRNARANTDFTPRSARAAPFTDSRSYTYAAWRSFSSESNCSRLPCHHGAEQSGRSRRRLREELLHVGPSTRSPGTGRISISWSCSTEPVALVLIHHEGEVEIVGGLADEIDLLLGEELERIAELVQDRADVAAEQADRGARPDHFHAAQLA